MIVSELVALWIISCNFVVKLRFNRLEHLRRELVLKHLLLLAQDGGLQDVVDPLVPRS